ncbi:CBS domain-containing protein [Sinirhodobacter huangdaonensis]|uniref:CBS domain-containing protein n=1 Tax=Paenirhodobacter huangdaonensis TaxID=2501515 RepID=A0A443LXE8_9RHOB|nr:CBS domain-containing protein [Sinirhodobacter huangdaonensis]RWR53900.1 CBS domain-containing protein [Sinirhodobacter huangdaonensis]
MQVLQILKSKGDDGVVTVVPGTSVAEVARVLSARRIGALIVSTDGKHVDGIVSERDVVRELGRRGPAALSLMVEEVMTRNAVGCTRSDTTEEVMEQMSAGGFRHMPVIEAGEMVGLISIRDVIAARLGELHLEKEALTGMIMGN